MEIKSSKEIMDRFSMRNSIKNSLEEQFKYYNKKWVALDDVEKVYICSDCGVFGCECDWYKLNRLNNELKAKLEASQTDKMKPIEKQNQIERGENWIVEFWRVRGYDIVKTCLGISFTLHRKPKYESLGLDLQYLEQFEKEAIRRYLASQTDKNG